MPFGRILLSGGIFGSDIPVLAGVVDNLQAAERLGVGVAFAQRHEFLAVATGKQVGVVVEFAAGAFAPVVAAVLTQFAAGDGEQAHSFGVATLSL